jgi:hypothetical protein
VAEIIAVKRYGLRDAEGFGRASATCADPEACAGHRLRLQDWREFAALRARAGLEEVLLFSLLSAGMCAWIDRKGPEAKGRQVGGPVAEPLR